MERQQTNAAKIAGFLSGHPFVSHVHYPSLLEKKSFGIHVRQARGNGAVVSFETGSLEISRQIVEGLNRLEAMGVNYVFPVHHKLNQFAGPATFVPLT